MSKARCSTGDGAELAIGISATFTVDTLVPMLGAHLLERGLKPAFAVGPYNQIFQLCNDPASAFERECDVIVVLWRIEDLMLQEIEAHLAGDRAAIDSAQRKILALTGALADLRRNFSGMIVVSVPPFPVGLPGAGSLHGVHDMEAFYRLVAAQFGEQAKRIEGIHLFEMEAVQRRVGVERSFDARNWYLYRIPYSEPFFYQVGKVLARMVVASRRAPRKCVVLDCDNTHLGRDHRRGRAGGNSDRRRISRLRLQGFSETASQLARSGHPARHLQQEQRGGRARGL